MQDQDDQSMMDLNQHHHHHHQHHQDSVNHVGHGPGTLVHMVSASDTEELRAMDITSVNDAGAEYGLAALRDSPAGVKPFYPYSTLIRKASHPHKISSGPDLMSSLVLC